MKKYFLMIWLPILLLMGGIFGLIYHSKTSSYRVSLETSETSHIAHQVDTISTHLNQVISDLLFLSEQHVLKEIPGLTQDYDTDDLANDLLAFSMNRVIYDQIRFIDETGMEIVRINNKGNPTIVPDKELQFKGTRYYFKETLNLGAGEVFVSRFDLNIEKGEIERPFKPMIRFGAPIIDSQGQKRGVLILNYLAGTMFDERSKESHFNALGNSMLINSDGYWLHSPRDEDEWGFMLEERKDKRFDMAFPDASQRIHEADSGQFYKDGALFTFATLYPLLESQGANRFAANLPDPGLATTGYEGYYWKFISIVPPDIIKTNSAPSFSKFVKLYLFLAGLLAIAVRFFAKEHLSRRQSEEKFRLIFESSNDAMMLLDENGFIDCNDATLKMFGYKNREEFCSKHPADLSPTRQPNGKESRQASVERIATAFSEGRHFFEWTHSRANGEAFPAEVLLTPVMLEGKKILQANVRDISERNRLEEALRKSHDELELRVDERTAELEMTNKKLQNEINERKQAEKELRKSEERFRLLIERCPVGVGISREGKTVYVNNSYLSMFGYDKLADLKGQSLLDNIAPQCRQEIAERVKKRARGEATANAYETIGLKQDGTQFPFYAEVALIQLSDGLSSVAFLTNLTELKRADEALSKSKAEFEAIFNANDDAVVFVDTSRQIRLINPAFTAIFGYTLDNLRGKTTEILYADSSDYIHQGDKRYKVGAHAKQHLYEMHYRRKDGTEFISETLGTEVKNSHGDTIGFIGIMRDITSRKEEELAFQTLFENMVGTEGKELFEKLVASLRKWLKTDCVLIGELVKDGFVEALSMDLDGTLVPQYSYSLEGTPCQDVIQKGFCIYPEGVSNIFPEDRDLVDMKAEGYLGVPLKEVNGRVIGILCAISRQKLDLPPMAKEIIEIVATKAAMTIEHMHAEETLILSEKRLKEAQHLAHLGHWELDINKNELTWSDEVYQIFEIDPERFGASYEAFVATIHPDDRDFVAKAYTDSVKSRVPYDIVHRLLMEDGRVKHVNERCETVYGDDDNAIRSVGTVQDITENVIMEEKAKMAQAKLIQSNKMTSMGMLASSITHEINNPNNYIQHNASLLSKVWSDIMNILAEYYDENGEFSAGGFTYLELQKRIPQFVDGILDGSMRIKDIIGGIKGFARNDIARWDVKFSVNDAINDALSLLGNQVVKYTSKLHLNTAEDLPPVDGSKQQIEQVLINLIMNALQALPDRESAVSISTSFNEKDLCIVIEVKDEGNGIEEDVLKNMMEPFYSTRLDSGGTGLGLFISNSIIEEHKGTLEFETEIGRGTTATIRLPLNQKKREK